MTTPVLTRDEVIAVVGNIGDLRVARIIATGASLEEVRRAARWWRGESDVMGEARDQLSGVEAVVYDILASSEAVEEEER